MDNVPTELATDLPKPDPTFKAWLPKVQAPFVITEAERNSMKRMRAVESDSVKSTRKAKDKLHKACKRASEICERTLNRQEQNNVHGKHERVMRQ